MSELLSAENKADANRSIEAMERILEARRCFGEAMSSLADDEGLGDLLRSHASYLKSSMQYGFKTGEPLGHVPGMGWHPLDYVRYRLSLV